MSVEAITWALKQPIQNSSTKFVLVILANCANNDGVCWPSVAYITNATSQNRKTVMANMTKLKEMGFLSDTGKRTGNTNQVPIYQLNMISYNEKLTRINHYVYKLTSEDGSFYIGVRTCSGPPEEDKKYMGSGKWPQHCAFNKVKLKKEILQVFDNRDDAENFEQISIDEGLKDPLCMNSTKTGTNYNGTENYMNSTKNGQKQYQKRTETVPELGQGNVINHNETKLETFKPREYLLSKGVEASVVSDYLDVRKAKKAPLTKTAIAAIEREAGKAGLSLNEAITECCVRSWQSFKAEWYLKGKPITKKNEPSELCPKWCADAGFANHWEAGNKGCWQHNAHLFKNGVKIERA